MNDVKSKGKMTNPMLCKKKEMSECLPFQSNAVYSACKPHTNLNLEQCAFYLDVELTYELPTRIESKRILTLNIPMRVLL